MTQAVEMWDKESGTVSHSSPTTFDPLKICIVTTEIAGPVSNGGIGTAYTTLAKALAKAGHEVTILFTKGAISMFGPFEQHVQAYKKENITLIGLPHTGQR